MRKTVRTCGATSALLTIFTLTCSVYGCSPAHLVNVQPIDRGAERVIDRNYSLGVESTKYVGDSMVRLKDYYAKKTVKAVVVPSEDFSMSGSNLNGTGGSATLYGKKGEEYPIAGTTSYDGRELYVVRVPANSICSPCPMFDTATGEPVSKGYFYTGYFTPTEGFTEINPTSVRLFRAQSESIAAEKGYLNQELVYSGLTGNSIRITYREYTKEDLARPAFFQELSYDLNTDIIRFKGIRIKVHKATNEAIRFTVIEDGLQ